MMNVVAAMYLNGLPINILAAALIISMFLVIASLTLLIVALFIFIVGSMFF